MSAAMKIRVGDNEYVFDPDEVSNEEAMQIERTCACTFTQWADQVTAGSITALTALVWLLRRREQPSLKFTDVRFKLGDFDLHDESEETPSTQSAEAAASDAVDPTAGEEVTTQDEPST